MLSAHLFLIAFMYFFFILLSFFLNTFHFVIEPNNYYNGADIPPCDSILALIGYLYGDIRELGDQPI